MRGSAEAVKKQLGVATEEKPVEKKQDVNGHDDEKRKFVDALRNPKYIIRVKRMTPREWNNQKTNVEVWQAELPLDYQEIQAEVAKGFGGEKYRVAVVDPQSNSTIAADTFTIDGDPIIPESDMTQEEMDRVFMRGQPKSAADLTEEGLDRRARVSAKMLEVEALEGQLEEARKRREAGSKSPAPPPQDNSRVDDLERRLTEAKHQAELEARDRKHAEELRELKAMIAQNAAPKKDDQTSTMTILLEQMREDRKASDARFHALMSQMKDEKLNAVLEEVKAIKNRPVTQSQSLLDQAEAILKLKKVFGWGGDDDDDDPDPDKDDDRPWWERALDKLGGKLGDKLFEKFTSMEEKGEKVDREKFLKEMSQYADQAAAEAVAKQRATLPPPPPPAPALPIPPPPAAPAAPGPAASLPPPPVPASVAPVPPTPSAIPKLTLDQEIVIRVGGVLEMIEREMELRPNEFHWTYEGCFNSLPEGILEKVCAAPDPVAMIDAFAIQHISLSKLTELKAKIAGAPRIAAWLKAGHDELKEWWSKKLADPKFDPFEEEEEEEVEQP